MTRAAGRGFAALGAVVLVVGAVFHLTAVSFVELEAAKSDDAFFRKAVAPVWTFASINWLAFAVIAGATTIHRSLSSKIVLLIIAGALFVNAVIAYQALGPFAGAQILVGAGALFVIGAALR